MEEEEVMIIIFLLLLFINKLLTLKMYIHYKHKIWSNVCHYDQIDAAEMIEEAESAEQKYAYLSYASFFPI
jgi:hypothetical protein